MGAPTPRAALRKVSELRRELDAFERRQVAHALADGATYASIGRDLGLTRQAVHRRFRSALGDEVLLRLSPDVRRILRYTREEATAMQAEDLGSEHIVLGVLRAADVPAAGVLQGAGVTLARTRTQIGGTVSRGPSSAARPTWKSLASSSPRPPGRPAPAAITGSRPNTCSSARSKTEAAARRLRCAPSASIPARSATSSSPASRHGLSTNTDSRAVVGRARKCPLPVKTGQGARPMLRYAAPCAS